LPSDTTKDDYIKIQDVLNKKFHASRVHRTNGLIWDDDDRKNLQNTYDCASLNEFIINQNRKYGKNTPSPVEKMDMSSRYNVGSYLLEKENESAAEMDVVENDNTTEETDSNTLSQAWGGRVPDASVMNLLPSNLEPDYMYKPMPEKMKTEMPIPIKIETVKTEMTIPKEIETEIDKFLEYSKKHITKIETSIDAPISPLTGMLGFYLAKCAILNNISLVELLVGGEKTETKTPTKQIKSDLSPIMGFIQTLHLIKGPSQDKTDSKRRKGGKTKKIRRRTIRNKKIKKQSKSNRRKFSKKNKRV
jgi:hypothetical protein